MRVSEYAAIMAKLEELSAEVAELKQRQAPPVRAIGIRELMRRFDVKSPDTIYRWINEGVLEAGKPLYPGGANKWTEDQVTRALANRRQREDRVAS